ncbi:D-erythronate dehydrogenase [Roseovarius pacificus]|uniref:D-erythronate dehydrogenase n=1 Tax=Roseovarius pacificus TaxID=337701 RepID=UPI002A188F6A|nr:D-erythronate dehydrogenase [Roseovarius pacificus]
MRVVITGAAGFLGKKLTRQLIEKGTLAGPDEKQHPITEMLLVDLLDSPIPDAPGIAIEAMVGDITKADTIARVFAKPCDSCFHLAAVMSGQSEEDFDLGMSVNMDGTRNILQALRAQANTPRFVMASTAATMGGDLMPEIIRDNTAPQPTNSYGTWKAVCELMVNDFSRKGFINGRVVRLPTIVVRPGKPNAAASSFCSGMIREPLQGDPANVPVPPDTEIWVASPRSAVHFFIQTHELPGDTIGITRIITPPGLTVTAREMAEALKRVGGEEAYNRLTWEIDPPISTIVCGWAGKWESKRARAWGYNIDPDFDSIVKIFMEDDIERK